MDEILTKLTPPALTRAIKANLLAFFRHLRQSPATDFYETAQLVRWHTAVPHPWFNGVLCSQPAPNNAEAIIQDTIAFFRARQVNLFSWWLEPGLSPATWEPHLLAHGFQYDANTPGMALDLQALPEANNTPAQLNIVSVEDMETLAIWNHALINGFEMPAGWEADFFQLMAGLGLALPLRHYLGYLDGQPVATSSLFLAAGVAGVMFVATLPPARGRGIGAAMTATPLRQARAWGYRAGILQSSQLGFKVYQQLGFEKLCQVDNYYWANEGD
jgi:GNAT superfamily N-acetyltransferase